jgi:hypothetical protein
VQRCGHVGLVDVAPRRLAHRSQLLEIQGAGSAS